MGRTLRLGMAGALMGCLWQGVSQQNAPDPAVYESFFRQVAQLRNATGQVLLNGQPSSLTQPPVQDAIGLTAQESQVLNALASDCEAKIRPLDNAARPLIFEARLHAASGGTPQWLRQQLNSTDKQRNEIVLAHVRELKAAFGDQRFQMLD